MLFVSVVDYVVAVVYGRDRIYIEFYGGFYDGEVAILVWRVSAV